MSARLLRTYLLVAQACDGVGGLQVKATGRFVVEVVAQIRADQDQGFVATPDEIEHLAHRLRLHRSNQEWSDREGGQHTLQKGQLHLDPVLKGVRLIEDLDLGKMGDGVEQRRVHRHCAQRGFEVVRRRGGKSFKRQAMPQT